MTRSAGDGPPCPAGFAHGNMFSIRGADGFRCMHSDHGGNGRKFTDQEAHEYEMKESDMATILEQAASAVAAGTLDFDLAVSQVARQTKRRADLVREPLTAAVEAAKAVAQEKEEARVAQEQSKKAPKAKAPKEPTQRGEHVEPAEFAAVRDALGLRNKEVAAALQAAGMGCTLSRVTELTHSKGSSRALFVKFEAALTAWREANPAPAEPAAE